MRIVRPHEIKEFPKMTELSPEEIVQAMALDKAAFSAADLQQYTELDEGVPMGDLLDDLEEVQRGFEQRPK
jgi:hypothetical protein